MKPLNSEILSHALEFGKTVGLNCFPVTLNTLQDPESRLYIARPDKIQAAYWNGWGYEMHPGGSVETLRERALIEHEKGNHTHLVNVLGDSKGYMSQKLGGDLPRTLEVMFHEGFHRRKRGRRDLHSWLEESAANVVGLQAAVAFSFKYGDENLHLRTQERLCKARVFAKEFEDEFYERLSLLEEGKMVDPSHPNNNARVLFNYEYYSHFGLFYSVFTKIGSFRGFVELVSLLPKGLEESKSVLRAIRDN